MSQVLAGKGPTVTIRVLYPTNRVESLERHAKRGSSESYEDDEEERLEKKLEELKIQLEELEALASRNEIIKMRRIIIGTKMDVGATLAVPIEEKTCRRCKEPIRLLR